MHILHLYIGEAIRLGEIGRTLLLLLVAKVV